MSGRGLALVSIQAAGMVSVLRNMCTARRGIGEKLASASRLPAALELGLLSQGEPGAREIGRGAGRCLGSR